MKWNLTHAGILSVFIAINARCHELDLVGRINNLHAYLWANYLQHGGNYQEAQNWYDKVLADNPPIYAYKGYITFLAATENFTQLTSLVPQLDTPFAQDPEIQLLFGQALYKTGKAKEADERFIRLSSSFKTDPAIAFQATSIFIRRQEPENALSVIDNVLNNSPKKPTNFVFYFVKAQLHTQLNQPEKALENIRSCIEVQPHFDKGWLMLALLHEKAGRLDEAIHGYTRFLEMTGTNKEVEQHLTQLAFKQKMLQTNKTSVVVHKTCFAQALAFFEQKNYPQALACVDECLARTPTDVESKLLKIQILSSQKNYDTAGHILAGWIAQEPHQPIWYSTLHLVCTAGLGFPKAIALLEPIAHKNPSVDMPVLYLADWSTRAQLYDKALFYYKKALTLTHDAHRKTKLLFYLALIYYDLGHADAMEKTLEHGLALGTNFPPLLNLLAYHYASNNKKLDVAQKLIDSALKTSKNPHFLDTQALIWYQQKEYTKALTTLQSIAAKAPRDGSILRTLGKTYYQMGNYQEAVTTIKQAQHQAQRTCDKNECTALLKTWERITK